MITSATGAANLGQYYALGQDNYYKTIRENGFETFGSGRETYGLQAGIKEDHFHALAGQTWNKDLQRWEGGRDIAAKDLTVEVPKSLSLLYEMTDDPELRNQIREAMEAANKDMLGTLESSGIFRVKVHHGDGTFSYHQAENMIYGIVPMHNTSRAQDPHLHIHNLGANSATIKGDTSGKEYAVDHDYIRQNRKFLDNVFHASLASRLQEIGVNLDLLEQGKHFRVSGITEEQEEHFSKRQNQIKENLWKKGLDLESASKSQKDAAWKETRAWKVDVAEETLRTRWQEESQEIGLDLSAAYTPPFRRDPNSPAMSDKDLPPVPTYTIHVRGDFGEREARIVGIAEARENAVFEAMTDCSERLGVFKRRDIYREAVEVAKEQGHALTLDEFQFYYDQYSEKFGMFAIGSKSAHDDTFIAQKLTTQKFIDAEKSFLNLAREFAANPSDAPIVADVAVKIDDWNANNLKTRGWQLNDEQQTMVATLCGRDRLVWVQGRAGAGKTSALEAAADIVGRDKIVGLSLQGKAGAVLQSDTGIASDTIHRFLGQIKRGDQALIKRIRGGVICMDEAAMTGTVQFDRIMQVAKEYGARVWGVGDSDQILAVEAGAAMPEALGREVGKMVELVEVMRQDKAADRKVVQEVATKHAIATAVKHFQEDGYVNEIFNRDKRHAAMIDKLVSLYGSHGMPAQIITPQNVDRLRLNAIAHDRLRAEGILSGREFVFQDLVDGDGKAIGERRFCVGERITCLKGSNEKKHGVKVKNGEIGTIRAIDGSNIILWIGDPEKPKDGREVLIDANKYKHLDLAWAISANKSQGITKRLTIIEAKGKMLSFNTFYVLVSRYKEQCHIYTDNKFKMIKSAQRKQSKSSALGIEEDIKARSEGHSYANAILQAFQVREARDRETQQRIGQALGENKAAFWHLAPRDLRKECNAAFEASRKRFALDLAAARSEGGFEIDSVTQKLNKAHDAWLERHEKLKTDFRSEVATIKAKANGKNVDCKIDKLSKQYHTKHANNDKKLFTLAAEYNPIFAEQLKQQRLAELKNVDADSTTIAQKQALLRGEVTDPLPELRPQAETVRQAVVVHQDASEKIRKEMRESAKRQERRGRDGLSERQKERFKRRYADADQALAAKIAEATGDGAGTFTFRREFQAETKRHAKAMREINSMKAEEAKAKGVKIRDLRREEMARHHDSLDRVVISHESRSEATREIRDAELAHRERVKDLATARGEAKEAAKAEGRELTAEETKRFSALRNIEEKRFRGELAVIGERHEMTPEFAWDVREHYRQQGKDIAELRQADAGGAHEAVEAKRGESDKVLADLEAADRQRPKILSEIRAAQREHAEERNELNRAHAEDRERLNALGVTPGADFKNKCNAEHAANNARLDAEVNGIIDKYAHHDPEAAQALRDTMAVKVIEDAENRKLSGALAKAHGGFDRAPQEEKDKIIQGYRNNEARRDARLIEIERSMGVRQAALDQGQEAPAHTFGEIKPHDDRPEIIRDIQSTLEAHESKKFELKCAQKEEGDKMQAEGKELSKEWNDVWNAKYQNANAEFQREINKVVEKYAGEDPQAAKEIREALTEQQTQDQGTKKQAGELARAHGNDFRKVPAEDKAKIAEQYREHERTRNDRLMAAQRGIVERRQLAAPSPAPSMARPETAVKPEASGPEFSHGGMSHGGLNHGGASVFDAPPGARPEPPKAEQPAAMGSEAERPVVAAPDLAPEHQPVEQQAATYRPPVRPRPQAPERERPQVAPAPEPSRAQPSPTLASSAEPAKQEAGGPEFSHGKGSPGELRPGQTSPGDDLRPGEEPPVHLTTTPEIRNWWDAQRSKAGGPAEKPQEALIEPEINPARVEVIQEPKTATEAPQAAKVVVNDLPPPPDWEKRYAEVMAKAQRDAAMERMAAGPKPVPAKPAEDPVAKAEAQVREFEQAQKEARERDTARMKERAREDERRYGPRVAAASDEIIRGTVVQAEIKGGRLNVVVDCGNGRYRVAALPPMSNVTVGQSGELRQQKNNMYSFTASNFQNMQAVNRFDARRNSLMPALDAAKIDLGKALKIEKRIHL